MRVLSCRINRNVVSLIRKNGIMKKFILLILVLLLNITPSFSKNVNNLFTIRNANLKEFSNDLQKKLVDTQVKDCVFFSDTENFYYIKLYQSGENINIFCVCEKEKSDEFKNLFKTINQKTYTFSDKDLAENYLKDYKKFLYLNQITVKDVKSEDNAYNPYNKRLDNKILRTTSYTEANIEFVVNKVKMKTKIKKYFDGFEISVKNNTGKNIILKKVSTGDFMGLTEIAKKSAIPQGVDFIPIYGIYAGTKTDLEKNKFSRPFPVDYPLAKGGEVRILGLSKILVEPIIDFTFEIDGKEKVIQLHTYE